MKKKIIKLVELFEKRNNIRISLLFDVTNAGKVTEFWEDNNLYFFNDSKDLEEFLETAEYKKNELGLCILPFQLKD